MDAASHPALRTLLVVAFVLLLAPIAAAHSGTSAAPGDSLARATPIQAPVRIFEETGAGLDVHYYRLDLANAGDVRVRLASVPGREPAEAPTLFLFGPEFTENASAPADVERPEQGGVSFLANERAEGAIPALGVRTSVLLDRTIALDAGAHVLVVRSTAAAPIALLIDAPRSAWIDLFVLPGIRDDARAWTGAPAWPSLAAGALGIAAVAAIGWRLRARPWSLHALAAFLGAALCASSGLALAADAARSGAGWLHAIAGVAAAGLAIASTRPPLARPRWWQRIALGAAGALALVTFAGALWGPIAMVAGALLPEPSDQSSESTRRA